MLPCRHAQLSLIGTGLDIDYKHYAWMLRASPPSTSKTVTRLYFCKDALRSMKWSVISLTTTVGLREFDDATPLLLVSKRGFAFSLLLILSIPFRHRINLEYIF